MVIMKIKHSIYKQLADDLKRSEVSIILGPRQVGKTALSRDGGRDCLFHKSHCGRRLSRQTGSSCGFHDARGDVGRVFLSPIPGVE